MARTHGHSSSLLYNTWRGMIGRCQCQSTRFYENYGGRGITVCEEWQDASAFIAWAKANGWREGLTIERNNSDGNYCPENCRFATRKEQSRNMRRNRLITFEGVTKPLAAWAEAAGLHPKTVSCRIDRYGWSLAQALSLPLRQGKKPCSA